MKDRTKGGKRYLKGALGFLVTLTLWLLLAPQQLGGPVSYTTITGNSMEPVLSGGDLAVLRSRDHYEPGDAVAYRSAQLGQVVLHRIVEIGSDGFVMKGDNNDWIDSDSPTAEDVVGELWFEVPSAGSLLTSARQPKTLVILVLLIGAVISGLKRLRARRTVRGSAAEHSQEQAPELSGRTREKTEVLFAAALVAALCSATVAGFAITRPAQETASKGTTYTQTGHFSYSAEAPDGPVYRDGKVTTGLPVYLQLVKELDVELDYAVESEGSQDLDGTGHLAAEVSDSDGWKRSFPISSPAPVRDGQATLAGRLNLGELRHLITKVESATGVTKPFYNVSVRPHITVEGTVAGRKVNTSFEAPLSFQLDPLQLRLSPDAVDPLDPRLEASLPGKQLEPTTIGFASLRIPVSGARVIGLGGLFASVIAMLLLWHGTKRMAPATTDRYAAVAGDLLVPVAGVPETSKRMVVMGDFETLTRIARHYRRVILHRSQPGLDSYFVEHDGTLYSFESKQDGSEVPALVHLPPPPPPPAWVPKGEAGHPLEGERDLGAPGAGRR